MSMSPQINRVSDTITLALYFQNYEVGHVHLVKSSKHYNVKRIITRMFRGVRTKSHISTY